LQLIKYILKIIYGYAIVRVPKESMEDSFQFYKDQRIMDQRIMDQRIMI